jgi:hypothetical protein
MSLRPIPFRQQYTCNKELVAPKRTRREGLLHHNTRKVLSGVAHELDNRYHFALHSKGLGHLSRSGHGSSHSCAFRRGGHRNGKINDVLDLVGAEDAGGFPNH